MKAILAVDPYGGIGKNGGLPWDSLDGDLSRFKELTLGCTIIMGRKTWDSLPFKPLPHRKSIVVSSNQFDAVDGVQVVSDINHVLHIPDSWCIGGAHLISQCWENITEFHLTLADDIHECDTYLDLTPLRAQFARTHQYQFENNTYEIWVRI